MGRLGLGDLLPVLKPLVDSTATRQIALSALANSPSTSDRAYLFDLANRQDTVSTEVLRALSKSNKPESVRHWLQLLRTRPLPTNYYIFRGDLPLLQDEALLDDLLFTLQNLSNTQTLSQLLWALHGHSNEQVTTYLISQLTHPDRSVRYEAATSLRGNKSALLQAKLPGLLADSTGRTESLHHLVLEHELDSLQSIYEQIYLNPHSAYERSQALQYLGTYTRPAHQSLFWQVLTTPTADNWDTRSAALGLGRLGDTGAIEAIIAVSRRERVGSDGNAQAYVMALGMLKGEKARQEIETYRNSPEAHMRELARKLLNDW